MVEKAPFRAISVGCGECRDRSGARNYGPFSYLKRRTSIACSDGRRASAALATADGTRRSTAGTLDVINIVPHGMGLVMPWHRILPVMMARLLYLPQGSNSGAHRESYSQYR